MAGCCFRSTGRSPDDMRDSLAVAAALLERPDLQIGAAPEEAYWLLAPSDRSRDVDRDSQAKVAHARDRAH